MAEQVVLPVDDVERMSLFFPIKVVNGFVTCDFVVGCYACKFCLNRRYPDWQRMLEKKKVYRNTMKVPQAAELLGKVKALTDARVTLKIGHDTDMSLEESESQQLYELLPREQPIAFMRRGRLLPEHRPFYMKTRENLMVELTITPRSEVLGYHVNPFTVLESFDGVKANVFYTVGPICEDNFEEAREIIHAIPPNSKVWVRELISKDIPAYKAAASTNYRGDELREFALSQGHTIIHYVNCVVRAGVGLGFHKRGEFVSEPNTWQLKWCDVCKVKEQCDREMSGEQELQGIRAALADLGLTLTQEPKKFGYKSYEVYVHEDVNFGDECYLREITGLKIDLYKTGRKTGTALSLSIAERWKRRSFFPVDEVWELAKSSFQLSQGD